MSNSQSIDSEIGDPNESQRTFENSMHQVDVPSDEVKVDCASTQSDKNQT